LPYNFKYEPKARLSRFVDTFSKQAVKDLHAKSKYRENKAQLKTKYDEIISSMEKIGKAESSESPVRLK
jgi:hypothetical protein